MAFVGIFSQSYSLAASYYACVVYTNTIIHLSVGESRGYLPRREISTIITHPLIFE